MIKTLSSREQGSDRLGDFTAQGDSSVSWEEAVRGIVVFGKSLWA
jgi:hypothetical protein